jgi:hypothetical protein
MKKFTDLVKLTEASDALEAKFEFSGNAKAATKLADKIFEVLSDESFNDNVTIEDVSVQATIVVRAMGPSPVSEWKTLAKKLMKKFSMISFLGIK